MVNVGERKVVLGAGTGIIDVLPKERVRAMQVSATGEGGGGGVRGRDGESGARQSGSRCHRRRRASPTAAEEGSVRIKRRPQPRDHVAREVAAVGNEFVRKHIPPSSPTPPPANVTSPRRSIGGGVE